MLERAWRYKLKISRVAVISKEGHGEAKEVARDLVKLLLNEGLSIVSFPNLHLRGVDHVPSVKGVKGTRPDLIITVSGDGTILKILRVLDDTTPCLCVNVGGRGILAEIKPEQVEIAIQRILHGDIKLERRTRISSEVRNRLLPPALNEVHLLRQTVAHTPVFTIDLGPGAIFNQRMDGLLITTPTGSTGHSFSYGAPFLEGSLDAFMITPEGPVLGFPTVIKRTNSRVRVMSSFASNLVVDGQDVFNIESDTYITFTKHKRDAVFVRFDTAGPFRQLRNLGFK